MGDATSYDVAALALGATISTTGVVVMLCQERIRTNVTAGLVFLAVGAAFASAMPFIDEVDRSDPGVLPRLQGLVEAAVLVLSSAYMAALLATAQTSARARRTVRWVARLGYALGAWHAAMSALFPAQRLDDYQLSALDASARGRGGFWLFAAFWLVAGLVYLVGWVTLAAQRLDPTERHRAAAMAVAAAFTITATAVPPLGALGCGVVAAGVVLWGQMQHTAGQARRSAFLSRFLSPGVTTLVHSSGMAEVMRPHEAELTIVSCDLRGFTAYAEGVPSQAVIDLLAEYYEAVGAVVAEVDGTVTDYAGDGMLVLIGAPVERADHAAAGLRLAGRIHEVTRPVLERWATSVHPIGIGVGVASGRVTVGAIEASDRMEFTAVGTPVNVAARLCSAAVHGETLVDQRAAELAGRSDLEERGPMPVKGLTEDREVYALVAPAPAGQVERAPYSLRAAPGSTTS